MLGTQWKCSKYSSDTVARKLITASCKKLFLYNFSTKNNMYMCRYASQRSLLINIIKMHCTSGVSNHKERRYIGDFSEEWRGQCFYPPLVLIESTGGATRQQWQIPHSHWPTISLSDSLQRVRREKLGLMPL